MMFTDPGASVIRLILSYEVNMTFRFSKVLFSSFLFVLGGWSSFAAAQGKLRIVVSVDWEGRELVEENLEAMKSFRNDFPEVPLQHFLNAAYYTKRDANAARITRSIRSVLRAGDEHGLHIHAWRSLVKAAGARFLTSPSFVDQDVDESQCGEDCGADVPLTTYTESELRKVIHKSVDILIAQGFDRPVSFRAGGWQANNTVLSALAAEGFTLDSSATYAEFLKEAWGEYNLYNFVGQLWPQTVPTSQPYVFTNRDGLKITELPNNGCLSDYMTGSAMLKVFTANAKNLAKNPQQDVYMSIGFHQETAAEYLPRLRSALKKFRTYAEANRVPYEFVVAPL
jgi:hypothetical protein